MASLRPHLKEVLDLPEPLMSHNYVINAVSPPTISGLFPANFFQNRTESLDIPFKTINAESRHIMATNRYYAGFGSYTSFNANFYEDQYCSALKGFSNWQELIVVSNGEMTGTYSPASLYQAQFVVLLLDNKENVCATGTFKGVFPTQINNVSMNGGEIARVVVQVTFSVNKVDWVWTNR